MTNILLILEKIEAFGLGMCLPLKFYKFAVEFRLVFPLFILIQYRFLPDSNNFWRALHVFVFDFLFINFVFCNFFRMIAFQVGKEK